MILSFCVLVSLSPRLDECRGECFCRSRQRTLKTPSQLSECDARKVNGKLKLANTVFEAADWKWTLSMMLSHGFPPDQSTVILCFGRKPPARPSARHATLTAIHAVTAGRFAQHNAGCFASTSGPLGRTWPPQYQFVTIASRVCPCWCSERQSESRGNDLLIPRTCAIDTPEPIGDRPSAASRAERINKR